MRVKEDAVEGPASATTGPMRADHGDSDERAPLASGPLRTDLGAAEGSALATAGPLRAEEGSADERAPLASGPLQIDERAPLRAGLLRAEEGVPDAADEIPEPADGPKKTEAQEPRPSAPDDERPAPAEENPEPSRSPDSSALMRQLSPPERQRRERPQLPARTDATPVGAPRNVLFYSLLSALCPLIPLPFLDDFVLRRLRRRMIRMQGEKLGLLISDELLVVLTRSERRGLVLGCLVGVVFYLLKKIFRKTFFVLAIKDCVDEASLTLHQAWLYQYALDAQLLDEDLLEEGEGAMEQLRASMKETLEEADTRPINQWLKGVFSTRRSLMISATRGLTRVLRAKGASRDDSGAVDRALEQAEQERGNAMQRLMVVLERDVSQREGYRRELVTVFKANFSRHRMEGAGEDLSADGPASPPAR